MQTPYSSKKLLLIKAQVENSHDEHCAPPLGLIYLAAIAMEKCGWDVRLVDTVLTEDPKAAIRERMEGWKPDVIGLSSLTAESKSMHQCARIAREAAPEAIILAGGPHPSHYPDKTLEDPAIDGAAIGEGELSMEDFLNAVAQGHPWRETRGFAFRGENGGIKKTPSQAFIDQLDDLPFPAWGLLDIHGYAVRKGMSVAGYRRYMPIMTSRGCPYRCIYCHEMQGKKFRANSAEYVLKMIHTLVKEYDIHHFDIFDDIFNWDSKRMEAILDSLIENGPPIRFTFPNALRADLLSKDQIDKLCRSGCEYVCLAVETATPRLQKLVKKNLKLDKVMSAIEAFAAQRVFTVGYFMLGFPTETEEEIKRTIDYAVRSKLHVALFFTVSPYQGTKLHDMVKADIGNASLDLTTNYLLQKCNISDVPDKRFFRLKGWANMRFYCNPMRIYRIYRDIPRRNALWKTIKGLIVKTVSMLTSRLMSQKPSAPPQIKPEVDEFLENCR
jgi:radical SAM superfamily enzyme YgiQ (UPF0313 family)